MGSSPKNYLSDGAPAHSNSDCRNYKLAMAYKDICTYGSWCACRETNKAFVGSVWRELTDVSDIEAKKDRSAQGKIYSSPRAWVAAVAPTSGREWFSLLV
jgi:hypothetical protein